MSNNTNSPSRIVLTGLSGTGKTTVGRIIAKRLGWRFYDTDIGVVKRANKPIEAVFADDGEAAFRALEHNALWRVTREKECVIAMGGGAILSPQNRAYLVEDCLLVCLDAKVDAMWQRLESSAVKRPLVAGADSLSRIRDLQAFRHPFYNLADVIVPTDDRSPEDIADDVIRAWEESSFACAVRVPGGSHHITAGWGVLDDLGTLLKAEGLKGAAYVISDSSVYPLYGDRALQALRKAGFEADAYVIPAGEANKTLETAAKVYDWLVSRRAERRHAIVALGGGVVTDLAGFIAATFLRGVPLVHVPTSLLSMVDAAVGGKTAVDHREGKNIVGAFYQPKLVVADVSVLQSLPKRELISGWAEVIKHAFITDEELLELLETRSGDISRIDPDITTQVIRRSIALKAAVVSEDEREETGRRTILNYGHTIGHAIEAAGAFTQLLHGEAVAIGMMGAAEIGRRLDITSPELVERQRSLIESYGLPTRATGVDKERVMAAMALDKKVSDRAINWVLLEDTGKTVLNNAVPASVVQDVVDGLLQ